MVDLKSTSDSEDQVSDALRQSSKSSSDKISKEQAGYQYRPEVEYRCVECVMRKKADAGLRCAWFGPTVPVKDYGTCIYFAHGTVADIPYLGLFTKEELGYEENKEGFSCKRCEEFSYARNDCKKVDRNSPGDTPGTISPNACCDFWERDRKRGGMTKPELIHLMGA
jgi:hypothetical protein